MVMRQDIKPKLYRYWFFQLGIILFLCLLAEALSGLKAVVSTLVGALVFMIPNMLFAYGVFKHQGAMRAKLIVNSFYKAEGLKLVLTTVLFFMVFASMHVHVMAFFVTYIVLLATQWIAHIFI